MEQPWLFIYFLHYFYFILFSFWPIHISKKDTKIHYIISPSLRPLEFFFLQCGDFHLCVIYRRQILTHKNSYRTERVKTKYNNIHLYNWQFTKIQQWHCYASVRSLIWSIFLFWWVWLPSIFPWISTHQDRVFYHTPWICMGPVIM